MLENEKEERRSDRWTNSYPLKLQMASEYGPLALNTGGPYGPLTTALINIIAGYFWGLVVPNFFTSSIEESELPATL